MKNFVANDIVHVVGDSHVLGSVQMVSHKLKICALKERRIPQVQLGIEVKVQL